MKMQRYFLCLCVLVLFASKVCGETWDVMSDTWVATDGLGRTLPGADEVGPPKPDKVVAMFYFLWNGRHGEQGPFDVSKILAQDPHAIDDAENPLWGPMYVPHHWGESIFGYYVGEDEYVLRKHAQMLADAGVDCIIFDVTNQETYPESYIPLCRVFSEMRKQGNRTPQIAFLTPFWSPDKVTRELWRDLYSKDEFSEVFFMWKGKPLILADPALIDSDATKTFAFPDRHKPIEVTREVTAGQSFTVDRPLHEVAINVPTWGTPGTIAALGLFTESPQGKLLVSKRFTDVGDNAWLALQLDKPLPPGKYYLELRIVRGRIGWWSIGEGGAIPGGEAFVAGKPSAESRTLRIVTEPQDETVRDILNFFTFRKPQPDYFIGPTGPDQWSWLEVTPQHGFYTSENAPSGRDIKPKKVEQVAVGIGQNAVDGKLGVLSNPRSHGRSFHDGKQPPPDECDFTGKNFAEQWERALELDPEVVFLTGWNEWIMGRFPREAPFHGANESPVNFVDQFNREFSRDIEPMTGGHGDTFYYQMIAANRRFKGVRRVEPVVSKPIAIDGRFDDWKNVTPEFRDTIGDNVHRNERGWGAGTRYENATGRNDIIAAKVSTDPQYIYFYVRTQNPIQEVGDPSCLVLLIDTDSDATTGFLGHEIVISSHDANQSSSTLRIFRGGETSSHKVASRASGNELELAIPVSLFGVQTPASFDFKWADNVALQVDESSERIDPITGWARFTTDGDTAPNDRYHYRAVLSQ
ncbi:MAG: hypothetical protein ACRC46_09085 [Thermoguttaceae bacterium]